MRTTILRLIAVLRFGHGMSIRGISTVVSSVYGMFSSMGFVDKVCQSMESEAEKKMNMLNECTQNEANVMMYDETFPKVKGEGCVNLGVVTCENGLIRKVQSVNINKKAKQTLKLFRAVVGKFFNPQFFISDYDVTYPTIIKKVTPDIVVLKDFVHTVRQIFRDGKTAINKTKAKLANKKISKEQQKKATDLKKKLLRKQLNRVLRKMIKGFKKEYCAVGTIYIEGALGDLKELSVKFPSLEPLHKKIDKFIKKYIDTWATHMELYARANIPLTSNIIESKNSIIKAFSKKAKCYSSNCIEKFFNAVALYENFNIKTRGINKGTNAMLRAGIDLDEFGVDDFFEAVGISKVPITNRELATVVINI